MVHQTLVEILLRANPTLKTGFHLPHVFEQTGG